MSKLQIAIIVLLIIGIAVFGFLSYQKWQHPGVSYVFAGEVTQISGNNIVVDAPFPTQSSGRTVLQSRQITVDANSAVIEKRLAGNPVSPAKISDIYARASSLVGSQVNIFTYSDPKQVSNLRAYKIDIMNDGVRLAPGTKTLPSLPATQPK